MKILRPLFAATLAAVCVASALAHETTTPAGKWEWPDVGLNGKTTGTCELIVKDGVVTGTLTAMGTPGEITPGTFKDGLVSFDVVLSPPQHPGMTFLFRYAGKFEGDTLVGTVERPTPPEGERKKLEWKATRTK